CQGWDSSSKCYIF
nr:immunoglobulin light chain junction region [Macaca mulatta]